MKETQEEITESLVSAANGYARAGLNLMYTENQYTTNAQAAIGNLAIATELLLKAYIAKQNLILLYKDLPLGLRCALLTNSMPESYKPMPHKVNLKSATYKTHEFNDMISTFAIFFPEFHKRFKTHLKSLSIHRNNCVHAIHRNSRKYEVERTAFLFLSLVKHIESIDEEIIRDRYWGDIEKNEAFLTRFDEERSETVRKKISTAEELSKTITTPSHFEPEEWGEYPIDCPVCTSSGIMTGDTKIEYEYDLREGTADATLIFTPSYFFCTECDLELIDYDEMEIAGIDISDIDRSDEIDKWERDFDEEEYDDYYD